MATKKYIYNPQTLDYEEYTPSTRKRIGKVLLFILVAGIIGYGTVALIQNTIGSPKERMQAREIEYLKLQYDIANDRIDNINALLSEMQDRDDNIYRMIFEAEPIPSSVRKAGYGGTNRYEALGGYANSNMVTDITKKIDIVESQINVQSKSFDDVYNMAKNKALMLSCIPAIMPVKDVDIYRISSHYGYRTDPFYKVQKLHSGIDFAGPIGTHIYCTGDGVVEKVIKGNGGYGNNIIVNHGYGYKTRYAHINKAYVKEGQKVKRGEHIADMGNSGKSTAPHLHYEVIKNDKAINPVNFFFNDLTPEEYDKILELSERPSMTMD
ncbi:MAG: M23 family metallopeptidase [Bacteroidales bacterium]|jgi:murein DD-endopeptidase MepM/ murein hydrolase activator NlpD|nr:M23 family metallopeptidase [Bacteroidales bacterium]